MKRSASTEFIDQKYLLFIIECFKESNYVLMIKFLKNFDFSSNSFSSLWFHQVWFIIDFDCYSFIRSFILPDSYNCIRSLTNTFPNYVIVDICRSLSTKRKFFRIVRCFFSFMFNGIERVLSLFRRFDWSSNNLHFVDNSFVEIWVILFNDQIWVFSHGILIGFAKIYVFNLDFDVLLLNVSWLRRKRFWTIDRIFIGL